MPFRHRHSERQSRIRRTSFGQPSSDGAGAQKTTGSAPQQAESAAPDLARAERLGHRLVPELLGEGSPRGEAVRRALKRFKPLGQVPEDYARIDDKAKQVDEAVKDAYEAVFAQLQAGKPEQLAGVSDSRYASWVATLAYSGSTPLKSAMTGYIIEDHACASFSGDPMIELQVSGALRNSRPDVVITDDERGTTGYVDITATNSAGHVFLKQGNWFLQPYVAESLYPSINFADLDSGPVEIDDSTMEKIEEWRETRAGRAWKQVQKAYESKKERYLKDQGRVVGELKDWMPSERTKLNREDPEQRGGGPVRRNRYRAHGISTTFAGYYTSRNVGGLKARMKDAGVRIDDKGRIETLSFDTYLDARGIGYTWEDVQEQFALI